ncbi:MAG TPA: HEAT repeat domain-containing protein [Vicinamibacterales bacterium]|nr:HEAT repeat domain-containing protein [Vicinamibacterales bacterium]
MARFLAFLVLLASLATAAAWYSQQPESLWARKTASDVPDDEWLDHIYSQNPRDAETAEQEVRELGPRVLPTIQAVLRDQRADDKARKAALKACVVLEQTAAPAVPEVAAQLGNPDLTEEAALALSFMGPEAFGPLREALRSEDPIVRREALRSIGKLRARAPLDSHAVIPLLIQGMEDADKDVRTVAATYLGILHDAPESAVPALVQGLSDEHIEVRRASARALGSFEHDIEPAIPALRRAARDPDQDLAREAGLALIKARDR